MYGPSVPAIERGTLMAIGRPIPVLRLTDEREASARWARRPTTAQPHRTEAFKLSKDPLFVEKVRDIVGLYLVPPDRALEPLGAGESIPTRARAPASLAALRRPVDPAGSGSRPLRPEELAEPGPTLGRADSGGDLDVVVEARVVEQPMNAAHRARLDVVRAVDEARDARMQRRAAAHHAGLDGGVERHPGEPVVPGCPRRRAQGHDLGVRGGILAGDRRVVAGGEEPVIHHDYRADRDLAGLGRAHRFLEGQPHPVVVIHDV
jgi:hypothetical protein